MKKIISLLIVLCMIGIQPVFAIDDMRVLSDGGVSLIGTAAPEENVTLEVLESAESWLDAGNWMNDPTSGVKFVDVTKTDSEGNYIFEFYLEASGKYDCIVSYAQESERFQITYTNKNENAAAINEIKSAEDAAEVYDILKREDVSAKLMVADSEIYTAVESDTTEKDGALPLEKAAEIIFKSEKLSPIDEPNDFAVMVQKAALIVALNGDTAEAVTDIHEYIDIIEMDKLGLSEYYKKDNSAYLTSLLKKNRVSSIADFNANLRNALIFTNIKRSDDIDNVSDMLKQFADNIGVSESKITTACVRNMLGKTFESLDEIEKFIEDFAPVTKPNSGGGSSSGGGGGGSYSGGVAAESKKYSEEYENPPGNTEGILPFEDIEDVEWAKPAINALYTKGIISGKTDKTFCPNDYITREEFVKLIVTAFSLDILGNGMQFEDVTDDDWYYDYVRSAYYAEIVTGISETLFGAGQNITRQDIAVMGYRAAKISNITIPDNAEAFEFGDEEDISSYAFDAIKAMQSGGILNGDENGNFNPTAYATRAEAAKIIYNMYQFI